MHIIICDDDVEILNKIGEYCESICTESDHVSLYNDSKKLFKCLTEEHPAVDLFILDIEMPELDGLELKEQIANIYMDAGILFLTSHREMMPEAFGKNVLGFVIKENFEESLYRKVIHIKENLEKEDEFEICIEGNITRCSKSRIVKIKAQHIYTVVTIGQFYNKEKQKLETKDIMYRISLKKWMEILDNEDFYKVNRSLAVNLKYVRQITDEIVLDTGERLAVPVKKRTAARDAYNDYCMKVVKLRF